MNKVGKKILLLLEPWAISPMCAELSRQGSKTHSSHITYQRFPTPPLHALYVLLRRKQFSPKPLQRLGAEGRPSQEGWQLVCTCWGVCVCS